MTATVLFTLPLLSFEEAREFRLITGPQLGKSVDLGCGGRWIVLNIGKLFVPDHSDCWSYEIELGQVEDIPPAGAP